jgi:glutaredoxin
MGYLDRRFAVITMLGVVFVHTVACSGRVTAPAGVRPCDPPAAEGAVAPKLSSFGDRVVLSWVEPDASGGAALRYALREGDAWSTARTAARDPWLAVDGADVPGVVPLSDGSLAAHWTLKRDGSKSARTLAVAVSRDGGATWSAPTRPHRDGTPTEHGMATLVPRMEPGRFGLAWLDGRDTVESAYGDGGTGLYWADWNGQSFDPETVLDPRVCDCCKTAGALTPTGPLLAYRDRDEDERRDTSIVREDGGRWQSPTTFHDDGWRLTACPTNGPTVATRGDRAVVAWFTGANATPAVWAEPSRDGGKTFGAPLRVDEGSPSGRVDATVLPDGSAAVVWLEKHGERGDVRVRRIDAAGTLAAPVGVAQTSAARSSGQPRVVAMGNREVLVTWTDTGPPVRLRAAVVTVP